MIEHINEAKLSEDIKREFNANLDEVESMTITDKIRGWAYDRNLHEAEPSKQALKLGEEFGELFEGLAKNNEDLTKDANGVMYVVMTNLLELHVITVGECYVNDYI